MKVQKSTVPNKKGFYFVKSKESIVWQVLVKLEGFAPFMFVESSNTLFKEIDDEILNDLRELDWSREIDVVAETGEVWYGYTISTKTKTKIVELIKEGSKLAAVKFLKDSTRTPNNPDAPCLGLREAKEYIDNLSD